MKYGKAVVESLLQRLDTKVAENIEVVAIGGTALALREDRALSKDVDLCYTKCTSPPATAQAILESGVEAGVNPKDMEIFLWIRDGTLDNP